MGLSFYVKRKTLFLEGHLTADEVSRNKFEFFAALYGEYFGAIDISALALLDFYGLDLLKDILSQAPQMQFYSGKKRIMLDKADDIVKHVHLQMNSADNRNVIPSIETHSPIALNNHETVSEVISVTGLRNVTRRKKTVKLPQFMAQKVTDNTQKIQEKTQENDNEKLIHLENRLLKQAEEIEKLKKLLLQKEQPLSPQTQNAELEKTKSQKQSPPISPPEDREKERKNMPLPLHTGKGKDTHITQIQKTDNIPAETILPPKNVPEVASQTEIIKPAEPEPVKAALIDKTDIEPPEIIEKLEQVIPEPDTAVIPAEPPIPEVIKVSIDNIRSKVVPIQRDKLFLSEIGIMQKDYNRHPLEIIDEMENVILSRNSDNFRIFFIRIFQYLFCPPLESPQYLENSDNAFYTDHPLFPNFSHSGFWNKLVGLTGNAYILTETCLKNGDITPEDAAEFVLYSKKVSDDNVGIFIHSGKAADLTLQYLKQEWEENGILVILLGMGDIHDMLTMKAASQPYEKVLTNRLSFQFDINL